MKIVQLDADCSLLCNQNLQCHNFVSHPSICRLYSNSSDTGQIITTVSSTTKVGEINYDYIHLTSIYNRTCDYCYPDRYLVCRNSRCQCPSNTFWNDQDKCINQLFVDATSTCEKNNWCRDDMNMTCT